MTECKWCERKSEVVDMGSCPFCENKHTPIEQILCKKIASAVAPYAAVAPRYFHNDEKYCNVPYTDIETVAKEIARMFEPKVTPDIEGMRESVDVELEKLREALNLREETISGVDEIGMVQNAIWRLLQSQADKYEREKGEMVREMLQELPKCILSQKDIDFAQKGIKTIAQKYGVDLSE